MELKGYDFTRNPVVDVGVFSLQFEMCFMSLRSRKHHLAELFTRSSGGRDCPGANIRCRRNRWIRDLIDTSMLKREKHSVAGQFTEPLVVSIGPNELGKPALRGFAKTEVGAPAPQLSSTPLTKDEHLLRSRPFLGDLRVSLTGFIKSVGFGMRNLEKPSFKTFAQAIHQAGNLRACQLLCINSD